MTTLYIGGFTPPDGRAEGIARVLLNDETGALQHVCTYGGMASPSWLTPSEDKKTIFCVHETREYEGQPGGSVGVRTFEGAFSLKQRDIKPTLGANPCHIALSPDGRLLAVSNYFGGNLAVYERLAQGADTPCGKGISSEILSAPSVHQHHGHGINPDRQQAPHVHSVTFTPDGRHALAVDLGTDAVVAYRVEQAAPYLTAVEATRMPAGTGPRTLRFDTHRNLCYILTELSSEILVYTLDAQGIPAVLKSRHSMLPEGCTTPNTGAEMHISADGRFLYASNRGLNTIVTFRIEENGALTQLAQTPCGGRTPRHFAVSPDGAWLVTACQDGDTVACFAVNKSDGMLTEVSRLTLPSPTYILFAE